MFGLNKIVEDRGILLLAKLLTCLPDHTALHTSREYLVSM
jgi:hypothetical protein